MQASAHPTDPGETHGSAVAENGRSRSAERSAFPSVICLFIFVARRICPVSKIVFDIPRRAGLARDTQQLLEARDVPAINRRHVGVHCASGMKFFVLSSAI